MELWIRSQDREQLRKIVDIKYQKGTFEDEDIEVIIGTTQYDEWEVLGQYKTKKRALEVLDEIQRILHPTVFMSAEINTDDNNWVENGIIYQKYKDNFNIQELSTYVYEMPKD